MPRLEARTAPVLSGLHFWMGDIACAEGAIAAGCRFFAGYPITPASEIAERMARRLPPLGGDYLQMEDELGSMAAVLGASAAGAKSMTATSGPGLSLMLENLGLGLMMELPTVVVNVMRAGPSTGMPTLTSQGDMLQARYGSHGDYEIVAYVPGTVQEMFDLTLLAFQTAERLRMPVILLADQVLGHMTGRVVVPPEDEIPVVEREVPREPPGGSFLPYPVNGDQPARVPDAGAGYALHLTGLTHDARGWPDISPAAQEALVRRLVGKVRQREEELALVEERHTADAEVLVVAYGSNARAAWRAVQEARERGLPAGLARLITAWPFPAARLEALCRDRKAVLMAEINMGQMVHPLREVSPVPVRLLDHAGGGLHSPRAILEAIQELLA